MSHCRKKRMSGTLALPALAFLTVPGGVITRALAKLDGVPVLFFSNSQFVLRSRRPGRALEKTRRANRPTPSPILSHPSMRA